MQCILTQLNSIESNTHKRSRLFEVDNL